MEEEDLDDTRESPLKPHVEEKEEEGEKESTPTTNKKLDLLRGEYGDVATAGMQATPDAG